MLDKKGDSGQVLLTSAILLAIVIVIIALMLNNIIYATNVAYIGFMDGSKYEDMSIRQLTTNEAAISFQHYPSHSTDPVYPATPNLLNRTQYMNDYLKSINYLTNSKGKYVELKDTYYSAPHTSLATTQTSWDLVITDEDSSSRYSLQTGSPDINAPHPPSSLPKPMASFARASYNVTENGAVTLTVVLSNTYDQTVQVPFTTASGSATEGIDYSAASGTLIFEPGQTSKILTVNTIDDPGYEPTESFTVNLPGAEAGYSNAVPGSPITTTVSISDNDQAPTPVPTPPPTYGLQLVNYDVNRQGSGMKTVHATIAVKNSGNAPLHNVQVTLVSPTISPGGYLLEAGSSPVVVNLGTLNPGTTSTVYAWNIQTKNSKDTVYVMMRATATELPSGVSSPQRRI